MEYGWNRVADSLRRVRSMSEDESVREMDRSDAMSVRSSRSRYGRKDGTASVRSSQSPWADRLFINEWKQPLPPSVPSMHDEETQLEALQKHVSYLNEGLQQHNELREPMSALVRMAYCDQRLFVTDLSNSTHRGQLTQTKH